MADIMGLTGLRPARESVSRITCPPYDIIKPGSQLEAVLSGERLSLYHITLGKDPLGTLNTLLDDGCLKEDDEPCFYIYEQNYGGKTRTGVLGAVAVSDYACGEIIRHEKIFDAKVKGRLKLRAMTGYTFEPVFLLTRSALGEVLEIAKKTLTPVYEFTSCFNGYSDLDGIKNRVYRIKEDSRGGRRIKDLIKATPLYIADGHHRYHASLLNRQSHCLGYICEAEQASIMAYNRVINGPVRFQEIKDKLDLSAEKGFATPPKHHFSIYTKHGCYLMKAKEVPDDVIGRLDCRILEKELYPSLGFSPDMVRETRYFDYYPEYDLKAMQHLVDDGKYDLAVALHPVSITELLAVADAGTRTPGLVMPEKSTFFAPKILSGIFIYRHSIEARS